MVAVTTASTIKMTLMRLLRFMYVPHRDSASSEVLLGKLATATETHGTRFIVLDDLHKLKKSSNSARPADELKNLMEQLQAATFLFATTELRECEALSGAGSEQTQLRSTLEALRPMKKDSKVWESTLLHFDDVLPLCWDRSGESMLLPLSDVLFDLTEGRVGTLTELLSRAARHAINSKKIADERLTEAILRQPNVSRLR